jgi:hypothetical protein
MLLAGVAGCGEPRKVTCAAGFIGDPSKPPQAVMVYTDGASQVLSEARVGQAIPLEPPPQGGYVMYLAARVLNMDACVEFRGNLKDPTTGSQVGFDARDSRLRVQRDGWGWPDPTSNSNLSNVNGCPDYSTRDVQDQTYTLEMTVADRDGRSVAVTQPIVPTCMLSDPATKADCICACSANYVLGKCTSSSDGGVQKDSQSVAFRPAPY